jgi:hypothetical protein
MELTGPAEVAGPMTGSAKSEERNTGLRNVKTPMPSNAVATGDVVRLD